MTEMCVRQSSHKLCARVQKREKILIPLSDMYLFPCDLNFQGIM